MGGRRIAAIALTGALVAGGTGAAIAAVTEDEDRRAEQVVLDDAAKRLDISPEKLRDALAAAHDAQLDKAVGEGLLTREMADAIKQRRKASGSVLGGPRFTGKRHLFGGRRFGVLGPRRGLVGDLAKALELTPSRLREQLRDGKSIADVAKAQRKSLASVRSSVEAAVRTRLDKAVESGAVTQRQADKLLAGLDEMLEHLDEQAVLPKRRHRHLDRDMPKVPEIRPGRLLPGEDDVELVAPAGIFF